jgi:hypothetical protein
MSQKTDEQLSTQAQEIKNETARKANTATRVGTHLQDVIDSKVNKSSLVQEWGFPAAAWPTDRGVLYVATDATEAVLPVNTKFTLKPSAADEGPYDIDDFLTW